jgi:hypothetical protein
MQESENFKSDVRLLSLIVRGGLGNPRDPKEHLMLGDMEILTKHFNRWYLCIPEFHRRKKLPVEALKIPYTICFTTKYRIEQLDRPSLFQFFHTFDVMLVHQPLMGSQRASPLSGGHSALEESQPVAMPMYPYHRKAVPLG